MSSIIDPTPQQQCFADYLTKIYANSEVKVTGLPLDKPKISQTFAEKLFLGDDTWLGALQGIFMCIVTLGIGPLILYLGRYENKLDCRAKEGLIEEIKSLNFGESIVNHLDCTELSFNDLTFFRTLIGDFDNANFHEKLLPEDLKELITISLALHKHKQAIFNDIKAGYGAMLENPLHVIKKGNPDSLFGCGGEVISSGGDIFIKIDSKALTLMERADFLVSFKSELNGMNLRRTTLSDRNLADANLNDSYLGRADFSRSNLCGAKMANVWLTGTNFTDTIFNGDEEFSLRLSIWNQNTLDRDLNHLTNHETGSILTAIESIHNTFSIHKLNLMHQLVRSLQDVDTSSVNEALLDIWMKNDLYLNDDQIMAFVKDKILVSQIEVANTSVLRANGEKELQLFLAIVNDKKGEEQKQFMLNNNGFFVQLLALCIAHETHEIKEQAVQLYHDYMNLNELKGYKKLGTYIAAGPENSIEEVNSNLEEIRNIERADLAFVFYSKDPNSDTHALIVSQNMIDGMLRPDPGHAWDEVMYNRNNVRVAVTDMAEAYSPFPLFDVGYLSQLYKAAFPKLLDAFDLNFTNPDNDENTVARDYTALFKSALNLKESDQKLTQDADQFALGKIFNPSLQEGKGITDEHFAQIDEIFDFSKLRFSNTRQAQFLICLSAMFVTYSSAYFFGQEGESPEALRNYATGLITKAKTLDANVFKNKKGEDQSADWIDRLTGKKGAFTCTAVLKTIMKQHAKEMGFDDLMGRVKPPGW
ncbi:MAG: sopA 4 [Solimicrobium sp.]|nr:sopA 4 [Solimicrobium sp.]